MAVVTSAVTGQGISELEARIVAALAPEDTAEPGLLDGPVPFTPRQVADIQRWRPAATEPGGAGRVLERAVEASEARDGEAHALSPAQRTRSERRPGGPQ
jgi:hypothetical protein